MKDKKLVKEIEKHCKDFGKKLDKLRDMFDHISEIEDHAYEINLSNDVDKSTLNKKEKLRLRRMLDKTTNNFDKNN